MNQNDIHELIEKQRAYFYSNETLNIEGRIHALKKLKTCIQKYETEIDFNRSRRMYAGAVVAD